MSFQTGLNQLLFVNSELDRAFKLQPMSCDHTVYLLEDESNILNFLPFGNLFYTSGQVDNWAGFVHCTHFFHFLKDDARFLSCCD
jgi:hypothetical protein